MKLIEIICFQVDYVWRLAPIFTIRQYCFGLMRKQSEQSLIRSYLKTPWSNRRPEKEDNRHMLFLLTYLGELFIQGYRIIEQFGDILLLSLMEFQMGSDNLLPEKRMGMRLPARYKVLLWQYDNQKISEDASSRKQLFGKMARVGSCLSGVQFHVIYLHSLKFSVLELSQVQKGHPPTCKQYFLRINWMQVKNGFKPLQEKDEGIVLHQLAQLLIKGAGQPRNQQIISRMQKQKKFSYDLFFVVNTVCYIVGKQMLQNDYQWMSSQKWMRYTTAKKFKRYDLLLRNEQKSGIIDWKFTKLEANEKIKGNGVNNKNKQYYQLACKDFLTDVELKFYCLHNRKLLENHHFFTCADYFHKIPTQLIDNPDVIIELADDNEDESIEIEDEMIDIIGTNLPLQLQVNASAPEASNPQGQKAIEVVINIDDDYLQSQSTQKQIKPQKEVPSSDPPLPSQDPSSKSQRKSELKSRKFKQKFEINLVQEQQQSPIIDIIEID